MTELSVFNHVVEHAMEPGSTVDLMELTPVVTVNGFIQLQLTLNIAAVLRYNPVQCWCYQSLRYRMIITSEDYRVAGNDKVSSS